MENQTEEVRLRVWWIPQVPGTSFWREVKDIEQAIFLIKVLADYDDFQYKNNIKPDYSNVGGLEVFNEEDQEWEDWHDDDGDDIDEYIIRGKNYD